MARDGKSFCSSFRGRQRVEESVAKLVSVNGSRGNRFQRERNGFFSNLGLLPEMLASRKAIFGKPHQDLESKKQTRNNEVPIEVMLVTTVGHFPRPTSPSSTPSLQILCT